MTEDKPIRPASSILLLREMPSLEVLMVRRHHQVDFMSGALVFPGGKVDAQDADPAWASHVDGWDAVPEGERAPRIAAIREAFEESGILLGDAPLEPDADRAIEDRKAVESGAVPFLDYVRRRRGRPDLGRLTLFSRWLSPAAAPKRFDTWFYVAEAPAGQAALSDGRETVDAEWVTASEALRLAAAGERTIVFPTRMNLHRLAETRTLQETVAACLMRPQRLVEPRTEMRDGVRWLVLHPDDGYGDVEEEFFVPTRPAG